ncbi:NrfD/PsrC family molybdoenzyme membrane anchor subunit [Rhodoferax sp.]|uniref:NrfD/PsrC family molybdoenzyme membrane anchor subunit n=1 Tax=Rhodoferax sp. TaxID=50421 RepID=UPI0026271587|nr:NrfD/PsrC family molybdoenzyme membrane anchor subunit [Rhodoferax sp.]MDD2917555.1 polysulfide reductase NrfD [Rhodoferax sp.]
MKIVLRELQATTRGYFQLLAVLAVIILLFGATVLYIEHHGHIVTSMNNQIVWGLPDVFAVFLLLSATGALSIALMASFFGKAEYRPVAPLSGLLAIAMLLAGVMMLMFDLGRPDRANLAMMNFNFKSVLAWNLFLYSGFAGFTAFYLWTLMARGMQRFTLLAISLAFVWRIGLTTGTGSIYGFQVARQAFDTALMAPMFIAVSLSYGLAVFVLVLMLACRSNACAIGDAMMARLARLQAIFIAVGMYFVLVYHLTNRYFTRHHDFEDFILFSGGIYPLLFWLGVVLLGGILPLLLLLQPKIGQMRQRIVASMFLVIVGAFAMLYVIIIGGQAFPLVLFPGRQVTSTFHDGVINLYTPSLLEWMLGFGGLAIAGLIVMIGLKLLGFLPNRLDDTAIEMSLTKPAVAAT